MTGLAVVCCLASAGAGHAQTATCTTDAGGVTQCSQTPRYQSDSLGIQRDVAPPPQGLDLLSEGQTQTTGEDFRRMMPQPRTTLTGTCRTDAVGVTRC
ncbi:hypothetical protein [Loktanella atrilutea]|uniref:hypothetical protein n=1 Tax=Loktanella atrilutea TaxID=366533 RepID=UPI0011605139|nr:hypothetical protein [Loktanella atrilutea]